MRRIEFRAKWRFAAAWHVTTLKGSGATETLRRSHPRPPIFRESVSLRRHIVLESGIRALRE